MEKSKLPIYLLVVVVLAAGLIIGMAMDQEDMNLHGFPLATLLRHAQTGPVIRVVDDTHETTYSKIAINYPQFVGLGALNDAIKTQVNGALTDHEKNAQENWQARVATADPKNPTPVTPPEDQKMDFIVWWEPAELSNNRVSIALHVYDFNGGAHGEEVISGYTYDLKAHKLLTLADVFSGDANYLTKVARASFDQLKGTLGDATDPQMLKDGTAPKPENFAQFTIDRNMLRIYFADYQVAPHAAGLQHVDLSLPLQ